LVLRLWKVGLALLGYGYAHWALGEPLVCFGVLLGFGCGLTVQLFHAAQTALQRQHTGHRSGSMSLLFDVGLVLHASALRFAVRFAMQLAQLASLSCSFLQ
jgi:hypothetical protein